MSQSLSDHQFILLGLDSERCFILLTVAQRDMLLVRFVTAASMSSVECMGRGVLVFPNNSSRLAKKPG